MEDPPSPMRGNSPPLNVVEETVKPAPRKRKKPEEGAEPRRLRRLHEACARCRRKKIKCDSKHPSCSACEASGVECNQEDRHRQTLKPRGYTDLIEAQIDKCCALLNKFIPGFKIEYLDYHLSSYGVVPVAPSDQQQQQQQAQQSQQPPPPPGPYGQMPPYPPGPHDMQLQPQHGMVPPMPRPGVPYGPPPMSHYPQGPSYPPPPRPYPVDSNARGQMGPPPTLPDGSAPDPRSFSPAPVAGPSGTVKVNYPGGRQPYEDGRHQPESPSPRDPHREHESRDRSTYEPAQIIMGGHRINAPEHPIPPGVIIVTGGPIPSLRPVDKVELPPGALVPDNKGQDPMMNDMSHSKSIANAFGVSKSITQPLARGDVLAGIAAPREDAFAIPFDPAQWTDVPLKRGPVTFEKRPFFLPRNREHLQVVVDCFFTDLSPHRPVFLRDEFMAQLNELYDSLDEAAVEPNPHVKEFFADSGLLCSVYLTLALGTLMHENRKLLEAIPTEVENWPSHDEFFDLALALKPDLPNTITTLQALILLHWYLYTERFGKALWRIVGNMGRLAIELGLHHDPREQGTTFTPEECQLRMRLWYICMIHDRATSIMFGRPLGVQRADFNTPFPTRFIELGDGKEPLETFSEHFQLGTDLLHVEADIVNSLYRPGKLTGEQIVLRSIEIERSLARWRANMPGPYHKLFGSPDGVPMDADRKIEMILETLNVDRGLTMLKYLILRMFLLRALFNNRLVSAHVRFKALHDAVITAHNVLVIHAKLTQHPEVAFFVSPIPVHVAAMVILFAAISKVETLAYGLAKEDVTLALKLVPLLRWRWPRQEAAGTHPLIARLAVKVYGIQIESEQGPISPPILLDEFYWVPKGILQSDLPPKIEEVWNTPPPGAPESKPTPVGLGASYHEQKLHSPAPETIQEQQELFVTATAGLAAAGYPRDTSLMDLDNPELAEKNADGEHYDEESISALMAHLTDQQAPTDPNMHGFSDVVGNPPVSPYVMGTTQRAAAGHVSGSADPGDIYEVWNNSQRRYGQ